MDHPHFTSWVYLQIAPGVHLQRVGYNCKERVRSKRKGGVETQRTRWGKNANEVLR